MRYCSPDNAKEPSLCYCYNASNAKVIFAGKSYVTLSHKDSGTRFDASLVRVESKNLVEFLSVKR